MIYRSTGEIDFQLDDLPVLPAPGRILLTRPTYYEVVYAINPYMADQIGKVDVPRAQEQWNRLREIYQNLDYDLVIVDGAAGLPDMVFCANQTLPVVAIDGSRHVVQSRMRMDERRDEVPYYREVFERRDYSVHEIPGQITGSFEGMGDALWHRGRRLLWGGYGLRTDVSAYGWLADRFSVPIIVLELDDPRFYHLDTCLSLLDRETALVYPGALTSEGRSVVERMFETIIEAPEDEAAELLACNAHCPDGTHVIIQEGCHRTSRELSAAGFTPVQVDLGEFLKAGGSVSCMKLMFW